MSDSHPGRAIVGVTDMFFRSRIEAALPAAPGLEITWLAPGESLTELGARLGPGLVLLDLQDPVLEPLRQVAALRASADGKAAHVVGFLPHVRMDLREAAQRAGFDQILTRSAFTRLLPQILSRAVTKGDRPGIV